MHLAFRMLLLLLSSTPPKVNPGKRILASSMFPTLPLDAFASTRVAPSDFRSPHPTLSASSHAFSHAFSYAYLLLRASSSVPDEQAEGYCSCIQHLLYGTDARSVVAFDDFSEHGVGGTPSSDNSPRGKKSSKEKSPKPAIPVLRSQSSPDSSDVARRPPGASLLPYQAATVPETGVLAASLGNLSPTVTSLLPPTKQKHSGVSFNEQGLAQISARSISTPVLRAPQSPASGN
jgi:hypothetical protein